MSQWPYKPISSLGTVVTGSTPKTSEEHFYGGDVPFVTPAELDQTDPIMNAARTLSETGSKESRLLPKDTVMVCCIGSLGKVGIAGKTVASNQQINSVIFNPKLIWPRFGFYACRLLKSRLESLAPATTVPIVNKSKFGQLKIPVPPLEEQQKIAGILDRAEALRAKRLKELAQLDELTQAIFIDMFGNQILNLNGWPVLGIEEICELIVDCVNRTAPTVEDVTPFKMIRTSNVKEGIVNLSDVKHVTEDTFNRWNRRATPQRGDVVLTREAPVGEAGIIDTDEKVFLGQRLMLYRADSNCITPEYLLFSFRSDFLKHQFEKNGSGSTVKHLPLPVCRSFEILVPPLTIQKEFSHRVSAVETLKALHKASLTELDELFASLQYRAFRGEL